MRNALSAFRAGFRPNTMEFNCVTSLVNSYLLTRTACKLDRDYKIPIQPQKKMEIPILWTCSQFRQTIGSPEPHPPAEWSSIGQIAPCNTDAQGSRCTSYLRAQSAATLCNRVDISSRRNQVDLKSNSVLWVRRFRTMRCATSKAECKYPEQCEYR